MFPSKRAAFAAAVLCVLAPGAHAATYTQVGKITGDAPDYTRAYADFAGFDPSLGTLNGAVLQADVTYSAHMLFPYAAMPAQAIDTVATRVEALVSGLSLPVTDIPTIVHFTPLFPTGGIAGDLSITTRILDPMPASFFTASNGGSGFQAIIEAYSRYNGTVPDPVSQYSFSITASMMYDYSPFAAVPEPASLTLLGGLLITSLLTRRARPRAQMAPRRRSLSQ